VSVALIVQHAMRMSLIILPPVVNPALQHFSTLSHKRHDFRRKIIEDKMCVLILYTNLCETFLMVRRTERYDHVTCPSSCHILIQLDFSLHTFEIHSYIKFYENPSSGRRVVPCGRTDGHKETNSHFSPFCKRA
jgi:hypothetical protein